MTSSAHSARGTDDGVAVGGVIGQRHSGSERDVEDVVRVRAGFVDAVAVPDDAHVVAGADDSFTEKESVDEVDVVAGCSHRHCQHLTVHSHFEWFLDGQRVGARDDPIARDSNDRRAGGDSSHLRRPMPRVER